MFSADVDALLIAIRGASGGDDVEVQATCPECETITDVTISVEASLQGMEELESEYELTLTNGLVVKGLPFTYFSTIRAGVASFQSTRSMQSISEMTDDMERLSAFNESFVKLADLNFELLVDSIKSIVYKNEEGKDVIITDGQIIREFLENTDNTTGKEIETFVNSINDKGVKNEVLVKCENEDCPVEGGNEFTAPINFDPVNFFTGS